MKPAAEQYPPLHYVEVTEQKRLNEAREKGIPWKKWGPLPERASVGHCSRRLQQGRQCLELLLPRPVPLARLPLGRRRTGWIFRRQAAALLCPGAVEWPRSHSQGALVRTDQQRRQSRRRRKGILLLHRQHADALVHEVPVQVSAARISVSRPARDQSPPLARRDGVRTPRHRHLRRRPLLRCLRRVCQRAIRKTCWSRFPCIIAGRKRRRFICFRPCGSATPGLGKNAKSKAVAAADRRNVHYKPLIRSSASTPLSAKARRSCCSRRTNRTPNVYGAPKIRSPYVKDAFHQYVISGDKEAVNPAKTGTKAAAHYVLDVPAGRK